MVQCPATHSIQPWFNANDDDDDDVNSSLRRSSIRAAELGLGCSLNVSMGRRRYNLGSHVFDTTLYTKDDDDDVSSLAAKSS